MTYYPDYKLYATDGITLVYAFDYITSDNSPKTPSRFTEISGIRGQGSIIIGGSEESWDLILRFFLRGIDYADLISKMDSIESTIIFNTPYILKIGRTISTTKNYNVKRIEPITWDDTKRVKFQFGTIVFRVGTWS
jgi:hypothetical protein